MKRRDILKGMVAMGLPAALIAQTAAAIDVEARSHHQLGSAVRIGNHGKRYIVATITEEPVHDNRLLIEVDPIDGRACYRVMQNPYDLPLKRGCNVACILSNDDEWWTIFAAEC